MERVEGLRALQRRLDAVASTPQILLEEWQTRTVEEAKNRHRPNKKTGMTSASIQLGQRSRDDAEVTAGGAAVYLEYGTEPHTIRPRRARMLAWAPDGANRRLSGRTRKGTKSSDMRFAGVVHHPGTKPYPFLVPGAKAALDKVDWPAKVVKRWNGAA
jgi:hypothetical protein